MTRRALVCGGSGYFGAVLARRLLARGDRVGVLDLRDADDRPPGVAFHGVDVRDRRGIDGALRGYDVVFDCVAQVPLAKDRRLFESVMVGGTRTLLEAAAAAGVAKVVHLSSSAVYGVPRTNPVDESAPLAPAEPYGAAKAAAERICAEWGARGLDVTVVRPRTILGHGRLGIFQILFEWIREGRNVPVLGDGNNRYQFVHADDLAEVCLRAAERPGATSYNAGAARFGTMREALEALCRHARTGSRVRAVPAWPARLAMGATGALRLSPLAPYHALMYGRSLWFDGSKVERELGYLPRWSNDEMLAESYDWYVAHREAVLRARGGSAHRSAVRQGILGLVSRFL